MEIKKKKMFKSKHSFCAQFHTKTGDSFLKRWNITNILLQIFSTWNIWFFWRFWPKNWKGWSHNIETFHKEKSGVLEKNLENKNFMAAALHAQIWFCEIHPIIEQHSGSANQWQPGFQIFLIWNNSQWEQRYSFAKFLISDFLKGLPYSAMFDIVLKHIQWKW